MDYIKALIVSIKAVACILLAGSVYWMAAGTWDKYMTVLMVILAVNLFQVRIK